MATLLPGIPLDAQPGLLADLSELIDMAIAGLSYTSRDVTLNSGQAAGTTAVLTANPARRGLILRSPKDCALALHSGGTSGTINLFAGVYSSLVGGECPQNALYVFGLSAGDILQIEEG